MMSAFVKFRTSFSIIFSIFKVAECSSTFANPPAKKSWLDLSDYVEVDKKSDLSKSSDLSDSSDLGSDKDNHESDDENESHLERDDDENIV